MRTLGCVLLQIFAHGLFHPVANASPYEIDTECMSNGSCFVLYNTTDGSTWEESRSACTSMGEEYELASIPDADAQRRVASMLHGVSIVRGGPARYGVWIGGKRSNESDWTYINGSDEANINIRGSDSGDYCVRTDISYNFERDNCDEATGDTYPFCQFAPQTQGAGACTLQMLEGFLFSNVCYYIHDKKPGRGDWYGAQTFCSTVLGGDLVYSHRTNTSALIEANTQVWMGISKYHWHWVEGTSTKPIRYYNWDNTSLTRRNDSLVNVGIWINLAANTNYAWMSSGLSTKLQYVLCKYVNNSQTSEPNVTTSTVSGDPDGNAFPVPAVAASVSVIAVAIVIIIVVIIIVRRNNTKHQTSHVYVNEGGNQSDQSFDQPAPQTPISHHTEESEASGYSTIGENRTDKGTYETKDSDEIPEKAIYAQPNKPKKNVNVNARGNKPSIKAAKPSLGARLSRKLRKAAEKDVEHVAAPSGDLYAVVSMKNIL